MNAAAKSPSALRRSLVCLREPETADRFTLGFSAIDGWLAGGLARGALHEIMAWHAADAAAAAGFTLALALRSGRKRRKIVWVRHGLAEIETGLVYAPGLVELGVDPGDIILVRVRDALSVLRAGHEAVRCTALSSVVIELLGERAAPDLTATRRLSLAAARLGVTCFLLRVGTTERPSAAVSRWAVAAAPSLPLAGGAPGYPTLDVSLLRHRHGIPTRSWRVEWNRDAHRFRSPTLPRAVASVSSDRPAPDGENDQIIRRAG